MQYVGLYYPIQPVDEALDSCPDLGSLTMPCDFDEQVWICVAANPGGPGSSRTSLVSRKQIKKKPMMSPSTMEGASLAHCAFTGRAGWCDPSIGTGRRQELTNPPCFESW